jgi:hypothetical protein
MTGLKKSHTGLRYIRYDEAECIGGVSEEQVKQYYINPCPTKRGPADPNASNSKGDTSIAIGINDICAKLLHHIRHVQDADHPPYSKIRFEFEYGHTGNGPMWGMPGGEFAGMTIENSEASLDECRLLGGDKSC